MYRLTCHSFALRSWRLGANFSRFGKRCHRKIKIVTCEELSFERLLPWNLLCTTTLLFFLQPIPYFLCFYLLSVFSLVDVIFLHKSFKDFNVFIIRPILSSVRTLLSQFFLEMSIFVYKKCSCKRGRVQFVLCSVSQPFLACKLLVIHHCIQRPLTWASNDNGIVHVEMQICWKFCITSLSHERILCCEWVPSEWESKHLIKTSQ